MKHAAAMQNEPYRIHDSYLMLCEDCGKVGWALAEHLRAPRSHSMTIIGHCSAQKRQLSTPDDRLVNLDKFDEAP